MILDNKNIRHIHFVGIGGIGVSALAEILFKKGYHITGSDMARNPNTERLQRLGVGITVGHENTAVLNAELVVYSSAIAKTNPEFQAACRANIPLIARGQLLAEIMVHYRAFAVAGAHGKTTTSALLAHTFLTANWDPSFMVGGVLNDAQTPARVGESRYFIAEADESDASFLFMRPNGIIITNIDRDHLETYGGDFDKLKQAYLQFIHQLPQSEAVVMCVDDPVSRELIPRVLRRVVTYGFSPDADYRIHDYVQVGLHSHFRVNDCPLTLNLPGRHNALNATAVFILSRQENMPEVTLQKAFAAFSGVGRRFHLRGEMPVLDGSALLLEDYGHHPTEIQATLSAVRSAWPNRRLVLVFQPHRYTRTRDLLPEFAAVLKEPDLLVLLDVYSAGESPIPGADGKALLQRVEKTSGEKPIFVPVLQEVPRQLQHVVRANDVVILQGAGNVGSIASQLVHASDSL